MPNQYEQHNHKDNKYTSVQHGHYMLLQLLVYFIFDNLYKFWLQAKYSPQYQHKPLNLLFLVRSWWLKLLNMLCVGECGLL